MKIKKIKDVVSWEVVGDGQKGIHPIYWLFWALVFFPALIVVFILHKKRYPLVELTYKDGKKVDIVVHKLDEITFIEKMEKIGAVEITIENEEDYKQCPSCAEDIKQAAKICRYCKESLI